MSAKGTSTFILQRLTAVLLIPLIIWFLIETVSHIGGDYKSTLKWISNPLNSLLMGTLIVVGAVHMRIGVKEVIDDYIHGGLNGPLNILNWLAALCVIGASLWSLFTL